MSENDGIVLDVDEPLGLADVRAHERVDQRRYLLVRKRLLPAHQCDAGGEPLQIPGEVSDERLVEVVDVEDEHSGPVHIRAEVLRMQIALDPHPARAVVGPSVFSAGDVGVEHTCATAVEGERVGRHLAELGPERVGVRLHEFGERLHEAVDDERFPLATVDSGLGQGSPPPGTSMFSASIGCRTGG